jgi:hypothetical protein
MGKLFQVFLSSLVNTLIYFIAVITGIACFMSGCVFAGCLIFTLLAIRVALDINAVREMRNVQMMFDDLMSTMSQNFNSNVVTANVH